MIDLTPVVNNYGHCLGDRAKLYALLLDLYPKDIRDRNIIISIYDLGLVDRIQRANQVTWPQMLVYAKIVEDAYGTNHDLVIAGLNAWTDALGIQKEIEQQLDRSETAKVSNENESKKKPANDVVDDHLPLEKMSASTREQLFYKWLESETSYKWMQKVKENQSLFERYAKNVWNLKGSLFEIVDPDKIDQMLNWVKEGSSAPHFVVHAGLLLRYKKFLLANILYIDPLIESLERLGLEYIDYRYSNESDNRCLWVIADYETYKPYFEAWEKKDVVFFYTNGNSITRFRPAWQTRTRTRKIKEGD